MADVDYDNSGNAGHKHCNMVLALALHLDEGALDPIEGATDNLHRSTLLEIHLGGLQVYELLIVSVAYLDEMIHLAVGNDDGNTMPRLGPGEVLQVGNLGLQCLYSTAGGIGKQQIADGRHEPTLLAMLAIAHRIVTHGYETAHRAGLEKIFSLQ